MGATDWARPAAHPPAGEAGPEELAIFVCGAHMSGMALSSELVPLGARFLRSCLTAPSHKPYALAGGPPQRPGLSRQAQGGRAIAGELWALPLPAAGRFLAGIPRRWASAPLRCRMAPRRSGSSASPSASKAPPMFPSTAAGAAISNSLRPRGA